MSRAEESTPRHDEREDAYVAAARVAAEREEAADAISGQLAERSPALTIITVRREHAIHAEAALRSTLSETGASDLAVQELENIFKAERFNRERFRDDTEFADWARSRCQFTLGRIKR